MPERHTHSSCSDYRQNWSALTHFFADYILPKELARTTRPLFWQVCILVHEGDSLKVSNGRGSCYILYPNLQCPNSSVLTDIDQLTPGKAWRSQPVLWIAHFTGQKDLLFFQDQKGRKMPRTDFFCCSLTPQQHQAMPAAGHRVCVTLSCADPRQAAARMQQGSVLHLVPGCHQNRIQKAESHKFHCSTQI